MVSEQKERFTTSKFTFLSYVQCGLVRIPMLLVHGRVILAH